jgi:hypothetical protein
MSGKPLGNMRFIGFVKKITLGARTDFAVRVSRARPQRHQRPPHPALYALDDRETPLGWAGWFDLFLFLPGCQANFGNSEIDRVRFWDERSCWNLKRAPERPFVSPTNSCGYAPRRSPGRL